MRILLTGFEPWGEHGENPSWEAAAALDGLEVEGARLFGGMPAGGVGARRGHRGRGDASLSPIGPALAQGEGLCRRLHPRAMT